ncbi:MAG: phosphoglycerate dehydrogenase [Candidatus Scalindua sp. AMX11]|nr:MAG: phosphoglycerate dehydrogenase [Candidatus Scalindua sp.]NOG82398.1 phosphoglycerate dehydrogenase [Planctomycetota bacterium]RZV70596.1 MAG: phosphoglycerate dehydrogenase [Candidatus Scalindua sp. SCAELEC01]TDE64173.1 MAG: phosphoglycerate dehydrogenase [Candidatus Scalindua sp. AMX11]GJQ60445.1 MAG: 2-hydroxyacid dehydrogenase [Candidatus Scalindua sp.]
MSKVIKILLCSDDDGLMLKTIEDVLSGMGIEEKVVLVCDTDTDTIAKEIVDADIVYPDKAIITGEMIRSAKSVKLFQYGTGYDTIDIEAAKERRIPVCNMPGVTAQSVAEHALYFVLALAKNDRDYGVEMREDCWNRGVTCELAGKTLGLLGFGNIGKIMARMAHGLGMNVIAYRREKGKGNEGLDSVEIVDLDSLLVRSDIISLHLPLVKQGSCKTMGLIGKREIEQFGEGGLGWVINTSRGPLINEGDLIDALKNKVIRKAALDVFEAEPLSHNSELRKLPNVILTPHIAGDTKEALIRRYTLIADNTIKVLHDEKPQFIIKELKSLF